MRGSAVRPEVSFAAVAAGLVAIESAVLASRAYALHPLPVRAAMVFDLCAVPALAWWLLVVRRGLARPRTVARVAVAGIALSALIFGREVRLLGAPIELLLLYIGYTSVRSALRARGSADVAAALRAGLTAALGDNAAARAVASELAVLWYALFASNASLSARPGGQPAPAVFTAYKRAGWTAIYLALAMATVGEGIALHFLLRRFGPLASFGGVALHAYVLLWLLGDLRALALRPISVENGMLHLRIGLRWEADIPLRQIERVERSFPPQAQGRRLGVLGSANLRLTLREPVVLHGLLGIRRTSCALLLQVDDPDALAKTLQM